MALTDAKIRAAKAEEKSYKLTDGAGLHLLIHTNGSRYWRLRYRHQGKEKTLALGIYPIVSLSEARNKRDEARKLIAVGIDPTEKKRTEKAAASTELSFETMTRRWLNTNRKWSDSHRLKVIRSFETHIFPLIGQRIINSLTTPDLLMPVRQAENQEIFETANRLQQRIASVMRYAVQSGIISYNPALDTSGAITTVKVRHRPALALSRISELVKRIDNYSGYPMTQVAVMLNLLVFTRSSELRYARWSEIDFKGSLWTIPAERIPIPNVRFSHRGAKMRTPHLVPLSHQAITLLRILYDWTGEHELILTGAHNPHIPLSENTVNKALRLMGYDTKTDICGHGFRSMACSSLIESGLWSKDAVERQMSHQERNDVRAAYIHKAEHLDERRLMVQWWADFIDANRQQTISPFDYAKVNNPFR
ncbi:tyrosine-type recombinase/integrase [Morganella morganii]|uniref:tyrosine-type recombinase/integrase n=1 Tax=Morganella morganii TaxID=582 RepID=UPI0003DC647C|nr:integrase arm-type DNA-binding domain-containing protein [Morganella morganii]EJG2202751.1 integrase arm-type DNA-binding domain-containing protein [Morganella morganii]ELN8407976.1 integrase arm-type DNA-binding domain-containing protein [Morganella morganii]MBT0398892.1 integrase arm-type DNA-binding domain-containing protein [Morganella morganii subsp. morganii]MDS0906510.1 integrase arm-type DNA-binding domain-containing protein [Morganella morganii]OPL26087.1 integrase [Morganella morg